MKLKIILKFIAYIFTLNIILNNIIYAQRFNEQFTRIDNEQGLLPGNVNDIVQDKYGFLWIGTESGLCRYDGYEFLLYRNEKDNPKSISHNNIFSLLKDNNEIIWIATLGGGLNKFNITNGTFKRYLHNPADNNSISHNIVFKVFKDSKNRIWISTLGGGLNLFNPKTEKFKAFKNSNVDKNSISSNRVSAIFEDSKKRIWVGTFDKGLNLYDESNNKFIRFSKNDIKKLKLNHNQIMDITELNSDTLLIATFGGGVNLLDLKNFNFTNYENDINFNYTTKFKAIRKIFLQKDRIWLGTHHGLYEINKTDMKVIEHLNKQNRTKTINNNSIREIYEDNSGLLWIGTNYGLNTYNSRVKNFDYISYDEIIKKGDKNRIQNISNKILWASQNDKYINKNRTISYLNYNNKGYINHYIDEDNILWIGNYLGLKYYDKTRKELVYIDIKMKNEIDLINDYVKSFYFDNEKNLWASITGGGLIKYDKTKKSYIKYIHLPTLSKTLNDSRVIPILKDSYDKLWIGTFGGLDIFDIKTESFFHYNNSPEDNSSLSNDRILTIYESKNKVLWIGTYQGLNKFNRKDNNFERFTTKNGLEGNTIFGITEDEDQNLWLYTNKGITKFNPTNKSFTNFNKYDGIEDLTIDGSLFFKDFEGNIYFGGEFGVNIINPNKIKENMYMAPTVITEIKIMGQEAKYGENEILTHPLNELKEINLSYLDKVVTIKIASLDYSIPSKNKYAYKLTGFNKQWVFLDAFNRTITLNNLLPGKYVLEIFSSNSDGIWNPNKRLLNIIVSPPFWETWWFRVIIIVILLLILFLIYEYRLQKLIEVERTRTKIARNLHDEVGGTLASIQYFVNAIRKSDDFSIKDKFLELILKSSNEAQENIRDLIWTVNPNEDGLNKFLIKFNRYASDLLDSKGINFEIKIPDGKIDKKIIMEHRQHLWCICKETITNIIKHSQCENIKIHFMYNNSFLKYSIEDDGKGFDINAQIIGNGIKNIQHRAKLLNADLEIKSEVNKGTLIEIYFKL